MKILILKNKLPFDIKEDTAKTLQYFSTRLPFPIIFEFKDIDTVINIKPYKTFQGFNPQTGQPGIQTLYGLIDSVKDNCRTLVAENLYDIVIFTWNIDVVPSPIDGSITSFTMFNPLYQRTEYIQLALNQYLKNQGDVWKKITHEILHALCFKANRSGIATIDEMDISRKGAFYNNDFPENPDSNYGFTLLNLQPYFKSLTGYKYFKLTEPTGGGHTFAELKPELRLLLDKMRGECGFPFKINSGYRTAAQNASLSDSVSDSAHLSGLAVDLACTESTKRLKLIQVAVANGITRLGIGKTFIHIDISKTLPQGVSWLYN